MNTEKQHLLGLVASIQYDRNLFRQDIGDNKYIMGCMTHTPAPSDFFVYKTIYDSILDLDQKIKKSFNSALEWEYSCDIKNFSMVSTPTKEESEAIYYTENAIFRTSVLWDLLAQLYNIKYHENNNPDKVYYSTLFHNDTQGKHPNQFAIQVYSYIAEENPEEVSDNPDGTWKGNHSYITNYRNQMTHRNSPNVATISNYAVELRMPMRYVLKRAIEDYAQASGFITQLLSAVIPELNNEAYVVE